MSQYVDAVFQDGVFRPEAPMDLPDGERVSLKVEAKRTATDDHTDLLDVEFMEACRQRANAAPSLEEVRKVLNTFDGSLADLVSQECDELCS